MANLLLSQIVVSNLFILLLHFVNQNQRSCILSNQQQQKKYAENQLLPIVLYLFLLQLSLVLFSISVLKWHNYTITTFCCMVQHFYFFTTAPPLCTTLIRKKRKKKRANTQVLCKHNAVLTVILSILNFGDNKSVNFLLLTVIDVLLSLSKNSSHAGSFIIYRQGPRKGMRQYIPYSHCAKKISKMLINARLPM